MPIRQASQIESHRRLGTILLRAALRNHLNDIRDRSNNRCAKGGAAANSGGNGPLLKVDGIQKGGFSRRRYLAVLPFLHFQGGKLSKHPEAVGLNQYVITNLWRLRIIVPGEEFDLN
jgi:hypothetical protein